MKTIPSLYRPCVGIVLFNKDGLIFLGKRNDVSQNSWQMPQGGIDNNEKPEDAALRELEEETGIKTVEILDHTSDWLTYDYPPLLLNRKFSNYYRGQRQLWFAMRFLGTDDEINLHTNHAEFNAWKWSNIDELVPLVVDFKKPVYREVVKKFGYLANRAAI